MSTFFALVATILTSFLPICNKYLLRDAAPAAVAWIINAASLPILAVGTLAFTQCHLHVLPGNLSVVCRWQAPHFDTVFVLALLASAVLNWAATLLSTTALAQADASLVSPLLTFNPAFTLLVATVTLGEFPGVRQTIGVAVVLFGAYVLEVHESRTGPLAPLHVLLHRRGALLAIIASALWGTTTVLEKLSIEHMTPPSGPAVALLGTFLMVLLLTPGALRSSHPERSAAQENRWKGLCPPLRPGAGYTHRRHCSTTAAGWLYDLLGRYNAAFCACVGVFLCASVGIALTPHPELPVREGK